MSEDILHELKKIRQWKLDRECLETENSEWYSRYLHAFNHKKWFPQKDKDIFEYYQTQIAWQFVVSDDEGTLLATLQDKCLEIRHKRNEYETPIGRAIIPADDQPEWRKLSWSSDGTMIAISLSNGEIRCFDALGNPACIIPKEDSSDSNSLIPNGALVSLILIEKRIRTASWPYELLALEYNGNLRSYFISPTEGFKPYHTFVFCDTILSNAVYVPLFNILVIAFPVSNLNEKSNEDTLGLSTWRLLNDYPYYRLVKPNIENLQTSNTRRSWISLPSPTKKRIVVVKMSVSQNGQSVACIHSCGSVSIWSLPQLSLQHLWREQDLPKFEAPKRALYFVNENTLSENFPIDMNWCSNEKFAIIRNNGVLTVSDTTGLENLLGNINSSSQAVDRQPEQVHSPAKLANISNIDKGFLILDGTRRKCSGRRDSEFSDSNHDQDDTSFSNALDVVDNNSLLKQTLKFFIYFEFFHQQKEVIYVERTYNLVSLKKVTSEELYTKKINNEEYEEALHFAKLFNLDENRVYKKQWERNEVTTASIENYLLKVTNNWWIMNECCQRIPESLSAAKILLNYGLQLTGFDTFINYRDISGPVEDEIRINFGEFFILNKENDVENFTRSQLLIFQIRKYLLICWDTLITYEKIIILNSKKTSYSEKTYQKLRLSSALSVVLDYARDGNAEAVEVMLTYYEELLPHWLKILDNIPECVPSTRYRKLLPVLGDYDRLELWKCESIREADWCESGNFKNLLAKVTSYSSDKLSDTSNFPFSSKTVTEWYESRIRAIVECSGLVDNALDLLDFARANNISGLERLHHNLLVLETLMYDLVLEDDISLSKIETYSEIDKLMLLMSKSNSMESFLVDLSGKLMPFLNRCEDLNPKTQDYILNEYFERLSENDLSLIYIFFSHMESNESEVLNIGEKRIMELGLISIYACQRLDQVEMALKIVQSLPDIGVLENKVDFEELYVLHSKVNELQYELEVLKLLLKYGVEKTVRTLHANKNNNEFQKHILTEMVNYVVDRINSRGISKQEIYTLLDAMSIVQQFFVSLQDKTHLRVFAYTMLTVNRNDCIEDYASLVLTCSLLPPKLLQPHKQKVVKNTLSYDESVAIVVEAAQYYYDIASCYEDTCISLAKACLSLISSHPDIDREKKLIDVLKDLSSLGVRITPSKIRTSANKTRIIEKILKQKPTAYRQTEKLLSIANNLDVEEDNRKSLELNVLNCVVDAAFQQKDYYWCSVVVKRLIENNHSCWEVCKKLCESEEYDDLETKQNLIKFALLQCNGKEIVDLVELRNEIERKTLRKKLQKTVQQLNNFGEGGDSGTENQENEVPRETTTESSQMSLSVPLLLNVLQTSSSNVLNVKFWKNTFNFNVNSENYEVENAASVDLRTVSFAEFYASIHEHTGCTCSSGETFAGNKDKVLQLFLRYYLLSLEKPESLNESTKTSINDVIVQLATVSYSYDCVFTLSLLLLLTDECAETMFNSLAQTDAVERFALYYYSLKLAVNFDKLTEFRSSPPSLMISEAKALSEGSHLPCAKLFTKYRESLEKRRSVNKLQDLGCGIDSLRFFSDGTYKLDSILGLAMYEERDKLDLALSLGREYDVRSEDIVLSHIKSLFVVRSPLLTERLKESAILELLKRNPSYTSNRIVSEIYDSLNGYDYQLLLLYYALLNQVAENEVFNHLKPKEHMRFLRRLKTFSKNIDYKLLTAEPPKVFEALVPVVLSKEMTNITNLLAALPPPVKENVNMEEMSEKLSIKIFFNGPATISYPEKLEICLPFFEKLPDDRITKIMYDFLFSKYSTENMENEERKGLLNRAVEYFSGRSTNGDENQITRSLKNYSKLFQKIDEFNDICKAVVDVSDVYTNELQVAFVQNDASRLKEIMLKMVLDTSVCADTIKVVLEFLRLDSLTDIITELLERGIDANDTASLLQRIENCLEDNEYETCWSSSLEVLINSNEINEEIRIKISKILSILEQSEEDVYKIIELLHETRLLLREWVFVQSLITLFDLSTDGTRLNLIMLLMKQVLTFAQVMNLYKVLQLWPPFSETANWENDPWVTLLERTLQLEQKNFDGTEELKLTEKIFGECKFSKEMQRTFFEHITSLPHNEILLVWYCVLTKDELLIQSVTSYVTELRELGAMPRIVDSYLRQMERR